MRLLPIAIFSIIFIFRFVCAILKAAHVSAFQAIDNTGTRWKFAGPTALARQYFQDCLRSQLITHPVYNQRPIFCAPARPYW